METMGELTGGIIKPLSVSSDHCPTRGKLLHYGAHFTTVVVCDSFFESEHHAILEQ